MYVDKIIKYLFPFLKEVILGRATLGEVYKYDKRRFWAFVLITTSISINAYLIPKFFSVSYDHIVLTKEYKRLREVEAREAKHISDNYRLRLKLSAYAKALKIENEEDAISIETDQPNEFDHITNK